MTFFYKHSADIIEQKNPGYLKVVSEKPGFFESDKEIGKGVFVFSTFFFFLPLTLRLQRNQTNYSGLVLLSFCLFFFSLRKESLS